MSKPPPLPEIADIVECKKGCDWSKEDRDRVRLYLETPEVLARLLRFAARMGFANRSDAEDVVKDFMISRLIYSTIPKFDPDVGDFWQYLLQGLKNRCREIRRANQRYVALDLESENQQRAFAETRSEFDHGEMLVTRDLLNRCLRTLTDVERAVILRKDVEERRLDE